MSVGSKGYWKISITRPSSFWALARAEADEVGDGAKLTIVYLMVRLDYITRPLAGLWAVGCGLKPGPAH